MDPPHRPTSFPSAQRRVGAQWQRDQGCLVELLEEDDRKSHLCHFYVVNLVGVPQSALSPIPLCRRHETLISTPRYCQLSLCPKAA
jgi:hypothetical protein